MITEQEIEQAKQMFWKHTGTDVCPEDLAAMVLANELSAMNRTLSEVNKTLQTLVKPFESLQVMQAGVQH